MFGLTSEDWLFIVRNNEPRIKRKLNDFRLMNDDGQFTDLIFLNKYLKINPLSALQEVNETGSDQYRYCLEFMSKYTYKFFISDIELCEDLKDFYEITKQDLDKDAIKLLKQGFKRTYSSEGEMREEINKIISKT